MSGEAIRLGRLLVELLPEPEAHGAAGADAAARVAARGAHRRRRRPGPARGPGPLAAGTGTQIAEGAALVERAVARAASAVYTLQAAIAAVHAEAPERRRDRLGARSSALYDLLLRAEPSPVVELNRAVAVAMRDGPAAGLALIDAILARGDA